MARKRILVVDDERDIVEIVRELLEGEGFATSPAYDGEEAWNSICRNPPDAVVLDIKMPGIDGLEVIRRLRASAQLREIPVVVLTATQMIRDSERQFQELRVDAWIAKPFEPSDLIAKVAGALQRGR